MNKIIGLIIIQFFMVASAAAADDSHGHFKGKPSETLEQALVNFSEYNQKLSEVLKQETLSALDMQQIHELTYTLENALEKINASMLELTETLEAVHVGSETGDTETTRAEGLRYLETARQIVK
ncbi:hypothetical protein SAMN05216326_10273 [Nitrosomonas marina]|uniref:Uncharacterized protein n=1 Tax=Nitrosomonas marina TaxID=917 RepID=A0A1H9YM74_9PROT|nr:DUF6746 family protein [Nitrosomonas marina]SES70222.1 hypothetical protein SAMN05216326_10273 [Nitrosomonas marina]